VKNWDSKCKSFPTASFCSSKYIPSAQQSGWQSFGLQQFHSNIKEVYFDLKNRSLKSSDICALNTQSTLRSWGGNNYYHRTMYMTLVNLNVLNFSLPRGNFYIWILQFVHGGETDFRVIFFPDENWSDLRV
jgi:hypothetical protein